MRETGGPPISTSPRFTLLRLDLLTHRARTIAPNLIRFMPSSTLTRPMTSATISSRSALASIWSLPTRAASYANPGGIEVHEST
jgi:hypothetical protein